eukprot:TRINITY_DN8389_c0_g1_i1.p1 TRINITY_DN8389_c0_g1~~TRINITY_DN8389_c0_g1_i1.p1  ORF type:complete len:455 (+),score=145.13 TRINITY_DN8389_c0_g1_i1:136-1500(+)
MCETSTLAYELSRKLVDEFNVTRQKEREMNQRRKAAAQAKQTEGGVSRTVTDIDYSKHENTVKELQRQEEEESFNRAQAEASLWCTLDHVHGPECRRRPMGCSHDHQKEWQIYEKSTDEKLKAADRFRQEGNEAFRKHNYGLAAVHYRKALLQRKWRWAGKVARLTDDRWTQALLLWSPDAGSRNVGLPVTRFDYTFAEGADEEKRYDDLKVLCLLNLAACKCQQEEWDDVLTQCRLALEINPRSVKAYYRTGLAHMARDNFELAKEAFLSAHEIEPHSPDINGALKQLQKNVETYKSRRKEIAKEMLSGKDVGPMGATDAAAAETPEPEATNGPADAEAAAAAEQTPPMQEEKGPEPDAPEMPLLAGETAEETRASEEPAGLRQRRPVHDKVAAAAAETAAVSAADPKDDAAEEDLELSGVEGNAMRMLLIAAGVLGALAVAAAGLALAYGDS